MENVSSEEELLQLRNEGRISEDEYEQLLGAMKRTDKTKTRPANKDQSISAGTSILAVLSLVFSIVAAALTGFIGLFVFFFPFVVPLFLVPFLSVLGIICGHLALRRIRRQTVGGRGLAIGGLIIGYIVLGLCIVFSVPFVIYMLTYNQQAMKEKAKLMEKQRDLLAVKKQAQLAIEAVELKRFGLDDMEGIPSQSGLEIDRDISSDGKGSLRIEVTQPTTVRLFETGEMDIENARLVCQAKVRTENVQGKVFLEMWCSFPGKGEFFSRGLMQPLTGTTDWITQETPFLLKKGENPDNIKLNLVIDGKGMAWIDDIRLLKEPLSFEDLMSNSSFVIPEQNLQTLRKCKAGLPAHFSYCW